MICDAIEAADTIETHVPAAGRVVYSTYSACDAPSLAAQAVAAAAGARRVNSHRHRSSPVPPGVPRFRLVRLRHGLGH